MPVQTSAAGAELDVHRLDMTVRRALAYAAGIGETAPALFDDARPGGIIAPPQFCVSPEWPVVSGPKSREAGGMTDEERVRAVHAIQDSIFHAPIRPGMKLKTTGRIISVRRARAGAHMVTRMETRDENSDALLVTSWSTRILRDVETAGEDTILSRPDELPAVSGADEFESKVPIAATMPHAYTECADIWNPIHTERSVALAAGLPDIILHGTATWALVGREVMRRHSPDEPERLKRLHGRFTAMVFPGHDMRVVQQRMKDGAVGFAVYNHLGQRALSDGVAVIR